MENKSKIKTKTIFPPKESIIIYRLSWICLFTTLFGIKNGYRKLALIPASVFLTSINHWRNPVNCWRRYIDVSNVNLCLLYLLYTSKKSKYARFFYPTMFIAMCCYPTSSYFSSKKQLRYATYAHSGTHIIGNLALLILFSEKRRLYKTL